MRNTVWSPKPTLFLITKNHANCVTIVMIELRGNVWEHGKGSHIYCNNYSQI